MIGQYGDSTRTRTIDSVKTLLFFGLLLHGMSCRAYAYLNSTLVLVSIDECGYRPLLFSKAMQVIFQTDSLHCIPKKGGGNDTTYNLLFTCTSLSVNE